MLSDRARDIGINTAVKRATRDIFKQKAGYFFETQKSATNEQKEITISMGNEKTTYQWRDTKGNLYKTETDGNRKFEKSAFVEIKANENYTWPRYTQYPPHKILTLPNNLQTHELPAIIKKINRETCTAKDEQGKETLVLPEHSTTYQMQAYLLQTIWYIYTLPSAKEGKVYKPEYKKALKNLYLAYQDLNPESPQWTKHPLATLDWVHALHTEILILVV